jgi:hypothetical protein
VIEVREISLEGVEVTLEQTSAGSNYDAIVSTLGTGEPSAEAAGPSVRVRDLWVRSISAHVRLAAAPPLTLELPEIAGLAKCYLARAPAPPPESPPAPAAKRRLRRWWH